tara:strand:+ start:1316 stop:2161 length:846 start_codon:yes stop_codon:yes gene_type:complete
MEFFNKKEEVLDIQLTQFGKHLLSVGRFRPVYYCFYDDDILYDSTKGGFSEHQNNTEKRILEHTPKLKTQYLTYSVEENYKMEDVLIKESKRSKFIEIEDNVNPAVQERILLYPMREQSTHEQKLPKFEIKMLEDEFSKKVDLYHLTGSGIMKKIPQLYVSPRVEVKRRDKPITSTDKKLKNDEVFIDLMGSEIEFLDGSKILIEEKGVTIDVQELNTYYGLDNFQVEIFEVEKNEQGDDILIRIGDMEQINQLFHIKTDEDCTSAEVESLKQRNFYRRNE